MKSAGALVSWWLARLPQLKIVQTKSEHKRNWFAYWSTGDGLLVVWRLACLPTNVAILAGSLIWYDWQSWKTKNIGYCFSLMTLLIWWMADLLESRSKKLKHEMRPNCEKKLHENALHHSELHNFGWLACRLGTSKLAWFGKNAGSRRNCRGRAKTPRALQNRTCPSRPSWLRSFPTFAFG